MVAIIPSCVATDGVNLYAIALEAAPSTSPKTDYHYVLAKSNPNPSATLSDISWTVVSVTKISDSLNDLTDPTLTGLFDCHVDETTKVFTILSYKSWKRASKSSDRFVGGVQYQPASDGGAGRWMNINASPVYEWDFQGDSTFYKFKDAVTGTGTLMQAVINPTYTKLYVSAMDPATSTMNQNPTPWTLDTNQYGSLKGLTFAGNSLYVLGTTISSNILTAIPISGASTVMPPLSTITTVNATIVGKECGMLLNGVQLRTLGSSIIFSCEMGWEGRTKVFVFDGKTINTLPPSMGTIQSARVMVAMPGDAPFLFMSDQRGLHSIPLSGKNTETWFDAKPINFTDSIFENLAPNSQLPGSGAGRSNSNQGVLAGVLCVVAALIVGAGTFVWYRRRSARNNKLESTAAGASKV